MGESKIEWTDFTFNPWVGCTKVGPGCDNCYAESWAKRSGSVLWGDNARRRTRPANWHEPWKWNQRAMRDGVRRRVFCASLADVFDNQVPLGWRADLFQLIYDTPHLDWLLLTKRIGNAADMIEHAIRLGGGLTKDPWPWPNVWIGATVVNQDEAERDIPKLLEVPAVVRFLSIEPMLQAIDLSWTDRGDGMLVRNMVPVDWVICGGESGAHARPMRVAWAMDLMVQCRDAGVPFFMKQGSAANWPDFKDISTFDPHIQKREFPTCSANQLKAATSPP